MANDKKNEVVVETTEAPEDHPRGDRGEVGKATAGLTIKQMWHEAHFVLEDVGDKHNPRKQEWYPKAGSPSLKRFARQLKASGNEVAKAWLSHKAGSLNEVRSEKNQARILLEAQASQAARRKKGQASKNKSSDAATTTVKK